MLDCILQGLTQVNSHSALTGTKGQESIHHSQGGKYQGDIDVSLMSSQYYLMIKVENPHSTFLKYENQKGLF